MRNLHDFQNWQMEEVQTVISLIRGRGRRSRRSSSKHSSWHTIPVRNQQGTCENSCLRTQVSTCASFKCGSRIGKNSWIVELIGFPIFQALFMQRYLILFVQLYVCIVFDITDEKQMKFERNKIRLNVSSKITRCVTSGANARFRY